MNDKEKLIESLKAKLEISNKKLEAVKEELIENNRLRMTIFSNLSHEIRTPLNGIVGFSEIMNTTDVSAEELKLYTGVIAESSMMLMSLLNDVFDIARLESDRYKAYPVGFDLNDLFFKIFIDFKAKAEAKELQLFMENLISEEYIVHSDPDIIKQILTKLLDNAIKFTKEGWVKLSYKFRKDKIIISVEDTGIGINEDLRSNLFDRFITEEVSKSRNIGGTGLDLSLCNGLVKLLGGKIQYESKDSGGSIFHFSILNKKQQAD